jgi:uncharacterized protein YaeQ
MALAATIFKADLQIADMDRSYYRDHAMVLARHPSETDERMMVRLLAFALNASESLAFGRGLSSEDEPDLCQRDLTGQIELWVDVGLPADKSIRKACGRAAQVRVYAYGGRSVDVWWKQVGNDLQRCRNLTVIDLPQAATQALARLARKSMKLQCTIQDGQAWLTDGEVSVEILPAELIAPAK